MINFTIDRNVAILSFNVTNQPMNVLNDETVIAFDTALQQAFHEENISGIIITSAHPEFIAGADLKAILRANDQPPAEMMKISANLNRVFRQMELWGKPVVAAINGTALGGGYEVCLACHRRIALNNSKTQIGLPESQVGLLPGGGGTQRLPRMIGLQQALPLMIEGKRVRPQEALKLGMVDQLAETPQEMMEAAHAWIVANPNPLQPWDDVDKKTGNIRPKDHMKIPGGDVVSATGVQTFATGTALMMDKTKGNYPAPLAIMNCVYEGLQVNIEQGLAIESQYFVQLARSKEAKNIIRTLFFGMNEANKGIMRPKNIQPYNVQKVGVLGAGLMGAGIAYATAIAGIEVVLKDISLENAEKGKDYSRNLCEKAMAKGTITQAFADAVLTKIKPTDSVTDLQGCDLIIEAVFENTALKAQVTQEAEPMLIENGIFASNTSTLPISNLAKASTKSENFIGLHFFSPVDKMQLVEIITGKQTSDYALAVAIDYVRKIKKTPIVVNDSRGFYTSRCFSTFTDEGTRMLREGINPILIENVARNAGMPVGPLQVSDEVNLDLIMKISGQSIEGGAINPEDPSYKTAKQMVELGRLGKKAKAGFYEYPANGKKHLWEGLAELFPLLENQPDTTEIRKRLMFRQSLETVRCYEENVIRDKRDADIGSILAWGFPSYTGGTLSFIEMVGLPEFVAECNRLADAYGDRFRPTPRLVEMATNNEFFYN